MDAKANYPQGHYHISYFEQQQLLIRNQTNLVAALLRLTSPTVPFNQLNTLLKGGVTNRRLDDATVQRALNLRTAVAFITSSPQGFDLLTFSHINDLVTEGIGLGGGELWKLGHVIVADQQVDLPLPQQEAVERDILNIRLTHSDYTDRALQILAYIIRKQLFNEENLVTAMLVANQVLSKRGGGLLMVSQTQLAAFDRQLLGFYHTGEADALCHWLYDDAIVGPEILP